MTITNIKKDQAYWNGVSVGRAQCPCTPTEPTYRALTEWIERKWPVASVHIDESGEVIIHTGLTVEMNGELVAIKELEEVEEKVSPSQKTLTSLMMLGMMIQ